MSNIRLAKELVLMARELTGANTTKELEEKLKKAAELARQFKDAHPELIQAINDFERQMKEKQDILTAFYKDWAKASGYADLKKEILAEAVQCMAIGETIDNLVDDITLSRRDSEQEAYKEKWRVLVTTLNQLEENKYVRELGTVFNKQITELKTGMKMMDGESKRWYKEAEDLASERGIKLPKASLRQAGIIDDLQGLVKSIVPKFIIMVKEFFSGMLGRIMENGQKLDKMDAEIGKIVAQARSVME